VFDLAHAGDSVARALVLRQGEEIGVLAGSLLVRVGLQAAAAPVVLGGGIGASGDPLLLDGVRHALATCAPAATLSIVAVAPIIGAIELARAGAARHPAVGRG
jgi:hypothetical protein